MSRYVRKTTVSVVNFNINSARVKSIHYFGTDSDEGKKNYHNSFIKILTLIDEYYTCEISTKSSHLLMYNTYLNNMSVKLKVVKK